MGSRLIVATDQARKGCAPCQAFTPLLRCMRRLAAVRPAGRSVSRWKAMTSWQKLRRSWISFCTTHKHPASIVTLNAPNPHHSC